MLVGDGAFQMTGTELSTHCRFGLVPIVIVMNNRGYSTERFILDGSFNDIAEWRFQALSELFGPLHGFEAPTRIFSRRHLAKRSPRAMRLASSMYISIHKIHRPPCGA